MDYWTFEREVYLKLWHSAYDAGIDARKNRLRRICNLTNSKHCHNGNVLKVYESAWEQGWDGYKIPDDFTKVEANLADMPLRSINSNDIF